MENKPLRRVKAGATILTFGLIFSFLSETDALLIFSSFLILIGVFIIIKYYAWCSTMSISKGMSQEYKLIQCHHFPTLWECTLVMYSLLRDYPIVFYRYCVEYAICNVIRAIKKVRKDKGCIATPLSCGFHVFSFRTWRSCQQSSAGFQHQ